MVIQTIEMTVYRLVSPPPAPPASGRQRIMMGYRDFNNLIQTIETNDDKLAEPPPVCPTVGESDNLFFQDYDSEIPGYKSYYLILHNFNIHFFDVFN